MRKKTILIDNSNSEYALSIDPRLIKLPPRAMIFIPLYRMEKFIGLFSYSREPENSIDKDLVTFLEAIAKYIGLAIANILGERNRQIFQTGKNICNGNGVIKNNGIKAGNYTITDIESNNIAVREIISKLPAYAECNIPILIEGETGTGKEVFASVIHNLSKRTSQPYIIINCGAIPENLAESELFGHVKGSFTGAINDKKGKFILANSGTIFLDEIGDLPLNIQVKILRFLESNEIEPLGSTGKIYVDVRIISATNKDLSEMVKTGSFREDLFYRLCGTKIKLPPLRNRKEDLPVLIDKFIKKLNYRENRNIKGINPEAIDILCNYLFEGNIRELKRIIEHAFIFCKDDIITPEHLPKEIIEKVRAIQDAVLNDKILREGIDENNNSCKMNKIKYGRISEEEEKKVILAVLEKNNGNQTKTAKELGIDRKTLRNKIIKYGL